MNKVKQFMNKITEKTNGAQTVEGPSTPTFLDPDPEEQLSAEGFLCPLCMTAFGSPETLAEHYETDHVLPVNEEEISSLSSTGLLASGYDADVEGQMVSLQSALNEEKQRSDAMQKKILRLEEEAWLRTEQATKARQNDDIVLVETEKLKKRLSSEIDQVGQLKLEKEILTRNISVSGTQIEQLKERIVELESQVVQSSTKDTENQVEVLTQKLSALQKSMEAAKRQSEKDAEELKAENNTQAVTLESRNKDLEKQIAKVATIEEESKKYQTELEVVKRDLIQESKKAQMAEHASDQLRTDVAKLREQHSELLRKFETGEDGNQAAMNELYKENQTLKESIDSTQVRLREVSINSTNLQAEFEKLQEEYKVLVNLSEVAKESAETQVSNLNAELSRRKEEIKKMKSRDEKHFEEALEKEAEIKTLTDDAKTKSVTITDLQTKNKSLSEDLTKQSDKIMEKDQEIVALTENVKVKTNNIKSLEAEVTTLDETLKIKSASVTKLEAETKTLSEALKEKTANVFDLTTKIQELEDDLKSKSIALQDSDAKLKDASGNLSLARTEIETLLEHTGASNLKELKTEYLDSCRNEKTLIANYEDTKAKLLKEVEKLAKLTEEHETTLKKLQALTESSKAAEVSNAEKETALKVEIAKYQKEIEDQNEVFSNKLKATESELNEHKAKVEQLTDAANETDKMRAVKSELEKKYKESEEGKSLLLERCLVGEANTEKLGETINELRRKLDDSQSALKELGRENQSLQVEFAKLQGRKWADDSLVNNCSTCTKEFSLTLRKHHCRGCGNIFCNDCTARTASIPSSKKPVRVCDACYEELGSK